MTIKHDSLRLLSVKDVPVDAFWSVTVGYRHQSVDFRDGRFPIDVELSGPTAPYVYRF